MSGATKRKVKIQELDLLRALAALSVIIIHVTAAPLVLGERGTLYHYGMTLANQFARFSIPAFIFVTGLALFYNYTDFKSTQWQKYFKKRVVFVLLPYIFWSAGYFFIKQYFGPKDQSLPEILSQFGMALLRGDSYYHLYFVVLVFQFYLLFPLLLPLFQRARRVMGRLTLLLFALYFAYICLSFYNIKPWDSTVLQFLFRHQGKLFVTWSGFFILGAFCAFRLARVKEFLDRWIWPLTLGAGLLLLTMVWEFYARTADPAVDAAYAATSLRPLGLLFTVVTLFAILALARRFVSGHSPLARITTFFSDHSYGIYLAHPLVLTFLELLESRWALGYSWWVIALNLILCLTGSTLITFVLSRYPWTRPLVGR
ncbi:acyltransferase [Desulforamulus ruminis]|uniref:acyltransferase n=1 Tax=Desulforamulus ruminis TaxID=1564 RepID=UPI0023522947|nr:acyltransferase [Desulforamulus ruminis]